ncbi:hypothetical protein F0562_032868 [Nyssa sinensis]|uniref:Uncharacterized protein n=1 Tax=Nyssa sinensis TaxID=561372 RepID=A0A5J5APH4_9ASTE|nr:hypothetical protein F0562_032868 [Nyssa sinensis]
MMESNKDNILAGGTNQHHHFPCHILHQSIQMLMCVVIEQFKLLEIKDRVGSGTMRFPFEHKIELWWELLIIVLRGEVGGSLRRIMMKSRSTKRKQRRNCLMLNLDSSRSLEEPNIQPYVEL